MTSRMGNAGVTKELLYERFFHPLMRMGVLEMIGSEQFQFRSPIFRFVDLCMQYAHQDLATATDGKAKAVSSVVAAEDEEGGGAR